MNKKDDNLRIYNFAREVPASALKRITGGRLNGFTDVNPVFRIKRMTELFGVCGLGWYYEITKQWTETYGDEVKCFCNINLYIKDGDSWSAPIMGTGGSTIVEVGSRGKYVSDEGYKMALTDALSVAMKSLGMAADVYFAKDGNPANPGDSKYRQVDYTQEAVAAMEAVTSRAEFEKVWTKYSRLVPTTQGSPFYQAAMKMGQKYPKP